MLRWPLLSEIASLRLAMQGWTLACLQLPGCLEQQFPHYGWRLRRQEVLERTASTLVLQPETEGEAQLRMPTHPSESWRRRPLEVMASGLIRNARAEAPYGRRLHRQEVREETASALELKQLT